MLAHTQTHTQQLKQGWRKGEVNEMFSLGVNYTKRNHVIICICGFCFPKLRRGCWLINSWGRGLSGVVGEEGRSEVLVGRRECLQGAFPCNCAIMPTLLGGCSRRSGQPFVTTIHLDNDSQPIFNSSPPAKCRQECEATPSNLGGAMWMKAN